MIVKYEPLAHYTHGSSDYIVFAKRCRNGIVKFKTKKVQNGFSFSSNCIPHGLIDTKSQWEKIIGAEVKQ